MGWSGGTELFDVAVRLLDESKALTSESAKTLLDAFESHDWDNIDESVYAEHPAVKKAIAATYPTSVAASQQTELDEQYAEYLLTLNRPTVEISAPAPQHINNQTRDYRKELWIGIASAIAGCTNARTSTSMELWANAGLDAFDRKFNLS